MLCFGFGGGSAVSASCRDSDLDLGYEKAAAAWERRGWGSGIVVARGREFYSASKACC